MSIPLDFLPGKADNTDMSNAGYYGLPTATVYPMVPAAPIRTECSYSFPGCLMPRTERVVGAPLVSDGLCPACEPRARQEMGLKPKVKA